MRGDRRDHSKPREKDGSDYEEEERGMERRE